MLWWFLILGVSTAVVVLVAVSIFVRVRRQMKGSSVGQKPDNGDPGEELSPPEV
jgi:hypothetical protein